MNLRDAVRHGRPAPMLTAGLLTAGLLAAGASTVVARAARSVRGGDRTRLLALAMADAVVFVFVFVMLSDVFFHLRSPILGLGGDR